MSVKAYTFRYDEDSDIGKWLVAQHKKSDSLEQSIRMMIANFGYNDLPTELPKRVKLGTNVEEKKEIIPKKEPKQSKPKEPKREEHHEEDNGPGIGMLSNL